ncbi:hypothetical protein ACA910_004144 [Epithemia clementina (nom. ined.)]
MLSTRFLLQNSTRRVVNQLRSSSSLVEASTSSVKDLLIDLTIVDPEGARKKIKGIIGKTLYEACEAQDIRLGPASVGGNVETWRSPRWTEETFGEGATAGYDHVVLTGKGAQAVELPPSRTELAALDEYWEFYELFEGSRLASCVKLNKEMDGMVVYVPERLEWRIM